MSDASVIRLGAVEVYLGEKSGKYPDGNQVVVRGGDTLVAFDTPLVANRLGRELLDADLVLLGHVHEDHVRGCTACRARAFSARGRSRASRAGAGLARHYGYREALLKGMRGEDRSRNPLTCRARRAALLRRRFRDLGGGR